MKICAFYLQGEKVIYRITGNRVEEGDFNISEVDEFFEKQHPDVLNIIVSKPNLIFRRIEFPFRNKKKVYMVMPSEIEDTLPESPDNFLFSFDISPYDKNKTVVNVYAVQYSLFNFWNNIAKKYRTKINFFSDTLLFHQFVRQSTDLKNYIAIYIEGEYLLFNIIENGVITGSYSYELTPSVKAENIALIRGVLEKKKLPVFICASQEIIKESGIATGEENIKYVEIPAGMGNKYLFHHLSSVKAFKRDFLPLKHYGEKKIPVSDIAIFTVFLIISFVIFSPYFKFVERQKKLTEIENEMKQIFTSTFPDVQNVVNPLIQAREKVMKTGDLDIKKGVPSVLKIMAEITLLFPEDIDAKIDLFRIAGDTVTLSGTADSLKTLEKIKGRIETSPNFVITNIGTISFDTKNRANFSITLKVK